VDEVVWVKTNQVRLFECSKSPTCLSQNCLAASTRYPHGSDRTLAQVRALKLARRSLVMVLILTYCPRAPPLLSHTKEHMLVGIKTVHDENGMLRWPKWLNRGLDTDVVVSEVRETSRKPDEVYGIIERMCPGGRKVEIFGRRHNTRPGYAA